MDEPVKTEPTKKARGGRKRTGSLQFGSGSWYALTRHDVDGKIVRKWTHLETAHKGIAKRKLAKLLETPAGDLAQVAAAPETYAELAKRIAEKRRKCDVPIADCGAEESREKLWILPEIGHMVVQSIRPLDIAEIYENAKVKGMSRSHIHHLRTVLRSRFAVAMFEETISKNPVELVPLPAIAEDRRERSVLSDEELAVYLSWQHPQNHHRLAVLERQTMSVLARVFGGLRTGDLHALEWRHFDVPDFSIGTALRSKTKKPQRIIVPEPLRPVLKAWWQETGQHSSGPVFPALRGEHAGEGAKVGVSHAEAFRRDLRRAFGIEQLKPTEVKRAGKTIMMNKWEDARELTPREVELLEETETTRPVDFHSWRRAFVQALGDAGINAQQAQKLAGHADLSAHERYLRTSRRILEIPAETLPYINGWQNVSANEVGSVDEPPVSQRVTVDSNHRPLAPEANALSS